MDGSGLGTRQRNQLGHAFGWRSRRHMRDKTLRRHLGDWQQIADDIEGQPRTIDRRIDRHVGTGSQQQRVSIGRRLGHVISADIAARPRAVLDDERLSR